MLKAEQKNLKKKHTHTLQSGLLENEPVETKPLNY